MTEVELTQVVVTEVELTQVVVTEVGLTELEKNRGRVHCGRVQT